MPNRYRKITFSIDGETIEIIDRLARKLGSSHSAVVRMAVRLLFERLCGDEER